CEAARRWGLPILVDVVRRPAVVEMLADQYPDVNLIVPHLGGFADDWAVFRQVIDQITRRPDVYADTSGVRYFAALAGAVRRGRRRRASSAGRTRRLSSWPSCRTSTGGMWQRPAGARPAGADGSSPAFPGRNLPRSCPAAASA